MKDQRLLFRKCRVNEIPAIIFQGTDPCAVEILKSAEEIYKKKGCSVEFLYDFHRLTKDFEDYSSENKKNMLDSTLKASIDKQVLNECIYKEIPVIVFQGTDSCALNILMEAKDIYEKSGCTSEFLFSYESFINTFEEYKKSYPNLIKIPGLSPSEKDFIREDMDFDFRSAVEMNNKDYLKQMIEMGYHPSDDGTYLKEPNEEDINLSPNQIKSASENVGTFSIDKDDIRFREEPDTISSFSAKYNLDEMDVRKYAESMQNSKLGGAAYAFHNIRRKLLLESSNDSLAQFSKRFAPIREKLYEEFGNVDELREEAVRAQIEERNVMEAARKRIEEEAANERERLQEFQDMSDEQLDSEYFRAVEENNEPRMRDLVNEAARRKGYEDKDSSYQGAGAWVAPADPGYGNAEERRADVEKNSPDVNIEDISKGYSPAPNDYFSNLRSYGTNTPEGLESAQAINNAIDEIHSTGNIPMVKVYRAVPTEVKESSIRNADWVTPSRKYAEMHGNARLEGQYRLIEQEVPANELWWDGNDINEWGFDDGNGYRYKNTENNRKLNDWITRDDNGNIIPLSQRFDSRKDDIRFRIGESKQISRDGRSISFTRPNPTATFKALKKYLDAEGIDNNVSNARTNSNYLTFEKENVYYDIRFSNHTKGRYPGPKTIGAGDDGVFIRRDKENKIYSVDIDLSENDYRITQLKSLINEIEKFNTFPIEERNINSYTKRFIDISENKNFTSLENLYPILRREFQYDIQSEELSMREEFRKEAMELFKGGDIEYTASNGISIIHNNGVEWGLKTSFPAGWEGKTKIPAEEDIIPAIASLAYSLHTPIHIINDRNEISDSLVRRKIEEGSNVKGWFVATTNKVAIYLPNINDVYDAQRTVFHEAVAHYGLRRMFGKHFDRFLDNVYNNAAPEIQGRILYATNGDPSKRLIATEEYLAKLAERGFSDPDEFSLWKNIKFAFIDMLRKAHVKLDFKLTDDSLRHILYKSYHNLTMDFLSNNLNLSNMEKEIKETIPENEVPTQEKVFYSSVAYLQFPDDTQHLDRLQENGDYARLLQEAKEYDQGDAIDLEHTFQSPIQNRGDDLLDENDFYAVVYNNSVGGTYEIMRKVPEKEVRSMIERYGLPNDASKDVKGVAKNMVAEKLVHFSKDREPCFEMPNGDILHFEYDRKNDSLNVGTVTNAGLIANHVFSYDHDMSLTENIQEMLEKLEGMPEYKEKEFQMPDRPESVISNNSNLSNMEKEIKETTQEAGMVTIPNEIKGVVLTEQQREQLSKGEQIFLENLIDRNGKPFVANVSYDLENNKLIYDFPERQNPEQEFRMPNSLKGVKLSEENKQKLTQGEKILLEGMTSAKGTAFNAYVYIDKEKNTIAFDFPERQNPEQEFRMPNSLKGVKLSEENKQKLTQGEKIFLEGMTSAKGTAFNAYVYIDKEKNTIAFDFPERQNPEQEFRMPNSLKGVKLSEENKQKLTQGEKIFLEGMTSAKGTAFNAYVYIDQEKKTLAFDFPEKKEKKKESVDSPQAGVIEKPKKRKFGL